MEEHKIITGMLLVALVVSVAGSMMVIDRMGGLSQNGISGAVTGSSDLNITQDITITLPDSAINFGSGKVDPDQDYAIMSSTSGLDTVGGSWANISDNITVRNDGNIGVNVTVQFSRNSGKGVTSFACASDPGNCGEGLTASGFNQALSFAYWIDDQEDGSCALDRELNPVEIAAADTTYEACGCLSSSPGIDEIALQMQAGIPADASGNKEATITFTSTASASSC